MTRLVTATILGALATASAAWSQPPYYQQTAQPYSRPVLSPYLNILNGPNAAVSYFGIVRPQLDMRNSLQQLQQQVAVDEQALANAQNGQAVTVPATGHTVQFMNYGNHFMRVGAPAGFTPRVYTPATTTGGAGVAGVTGVGNRPRAPTGQALRGR